MSDSCPKVVDPAEILEETRTSMVREVKNREKNLDIKQVLEMLTGKVLPGRGIPEQFDMPPWRVPIKAHKMANVVNEVRRV